MQFGPGNVVRSNAGRDKYHLYIIVSISPDRVMVADGQRRKIHNPKPKNSIHLDLVKAVEMAVKTDEEIRQRLHQMVELSQSEEKGGRT